MEYCSEDYSPSGAAEWGGLYREKPVPQQEFDNLVRTSVAEIMAAESSADLRPYVKDKLSKRFILITVEDLNTRYISHGILKYSPK